MHAIESIHAQLAAAARAIELRARRIEDALHLLASLTNTLRASVPVDAASLAAFLAEGDLAPDATGFFERRSLLARIRAGDDVRGETSWFWPSARKDDARVAARLAPLRHLGPVLLTLRERLGEVARIYYQDALNVALVHPALDMVSAVPPTFEWSTHPSVASVAEAVNPTREIRWTPPSIDRGGAGLVTSASIPVDDAPGEGEPGDGARGEGATSWRGGVWSIDVPLRTLHADVQLAGDDRRETFLVDAGGGLVAHPSVEAHAREMGDPVRLASLGGGFEGLDVAGLADGGEKEIVDAVGVRRWVGAKRVREIDGFLVVSVPVERRASAVTRSSGGVLAPPKARRRSARGDSVLVVDDEPLVREATILCLRELGYDVTGAASAEEARAEARRRGAELSLLITDLVMPGIGGVELAERVRRMCPRTRVLFVSGYDDEEHRPSARPGTAFLAKPFDPEELGRKVRELLDG